MFLLFSDEPGYSMLMAHNALSQYMVKMRDEIEDTEHEDSGLFISMFVLG